MIILLFNPLVNCATWNLGNGSNGRFDRLAAKVKRMVGCFLNALMTATARVLPPYFRLPVASARQAEVVYRERVYCYELYHQLRSVLDCEKLLEGYALSAEIDKQGHPFIQACAPDLLFHIPGHMNQNLVVAEVKPITAKPRGIRKDFRNLAYFVSGKVGYQLAVLLVYGDDGKGIKRFARALCAAGSGPFLLLWHRHASERAEEVPIEEPASRVVES